MCIEHTVYNFGQIYFRSLAKSILGIWGSKFSMLHVIYLTGDTFCASVAKEQQCIAFCHDNTIL